MKKDSQPPISSTATTSTTSDNGMAVASMVLGIVSFTGLGPLTGVPAIILGSISLKRKAPGRDMSIAGIITGAISTGLSLFLIGLVIIFFVWAASLPPDSFDDFNTNRDAPSGLQFDDVFDSTRT